MILYQLKLIIPQVQPGYSPGWSYKMKYSTSDRIIIINIILLFFQTVRYYFIVSNFFYLKYILLKWNTSHTSTTVYVCIWSYFQLPMNWVQSYGTDRCLLPVLYVFIADEPILDPLENLLMYLPMHFNFELLFYWKYANSNLKVSSRKRENN